MLCHVSLIIFAIKTIQFTQHENRIAAIQSFVNNLQWVIRLVIFSRFTVKLTIVYRTSRTLNPKRNPQN